MKKFIHYLGLAVLCLFLAACQSQSSDDFLAQIDQAAEKMTTYQTSTDFDQKLGDKEIFNQMSMATYSQERGTEGKLINKGEDGDRILQIISNPKQTVFQESQLDDQSDWQLSPSSQALEERVHRFPYENMLEILHKINSDAQLRKLGPTQIIRYEGKNPQLTEIINQRGASSYQNDAIHSVEFLIDSQSSGIRQVSWRVHGQDKASKKNLVSSIKIKYRPLSDQQLDEDFASAENKSYIPSRKEESNE
ncbi:hypothetical protein ACWOE5_07610 [Aerococcus sanguinicola]|uniref:Outer membrane lipoprotein-sorting protein n=1 Tax=Aerococcus sanguinicola TaxID=119206 RepID=A0A0X8FAR8_9LACT|nr:MULTISPECIES: hypothetical protein [Aerococcus]AMB93931.1 hypothetical protein AWM72_03735 [Aerococcus sanguinicola]MDK7050561.1 hypothetical protein [Aerococcus sanguinicola]OFT97196.1 hypothetical protein HMPREF3090_01110 [Aerococcus sp. HMSC23C02]PKZ21118.1 hypothetical protein CYJ28_07995 [Aerococcus sanguinicola]